MLILAARAGSLPILQGIVMLIQFLVGGIVNICNITIHALVMTVVVRVARASVTTTNHPSLLLITTMIATVSVLMAAHVLEVFVWSLAYAIVGAVPADGSLVYFAFVSYATLGYGDVLPVERWQLLGPMAAMNGALLFGWSTAVIFEVLQKTMMIGSTPPPLNKLRCPLLAQSGHLQRVAVFNEPRNAGAMPQFAAVQPVARSFNVEVSPIEFADAMTIERNVSDFARIANGGMIVLRLTEAIAHRDLIIALAAKYRLPAVYPLRFFVSAGGLMSYGHDIVDHTAGCRLRRSYPER